MDDYADIYYVDTRNAVRDHRPQGGGQGRPGSSGPRVVYAPPQGQPIAHVVPPYVQPQPLPQQVIYTQQPQMFQPSAFGSLFGKLTPGQLLEMVAQLFAALQPLPAAPTPTRSPDTDPANLILFQDALAKHAKRDEQVRTVGSLVARLIG